MKTRPTNKRVSRLETSGKRPPSNRRGKGRDKKGGGDDKATPKRRFRLIRWLFVMTVFGGIIGACALLGGYLYFGSGLPDFRTLGDYRPPQVSRILAADGSLLGEIYHQRRTLVGRDQIPDVLVHALISAEDGDFYQHEGLDYTGMLRALYNSLKAGRVTGSGSTITQQTVKNLLLTPERSFARKAKELILARRLEEHLTKDEILTIYVNAIYLGHGRYGAQEAARYYYGVDVQRLTLNQAATLAGMIQSPERISPRKHPERAKQRRAYVLTQMVKNGYVDEVTAQATERAPLELAPRPERAEVGHWFTDAVRRRLVQRLGEARVRTGGLEVHTTLDPKRQAAAEAALRKGLRAIDGRQRFGRAAAHVTEAKADRWRARRRKALGDEGPSLGATVFGRVRARDKQGLLLELGVGEARVPHRAVRRFITKKRPTPFKVGDILKVTIRADGPRHPAVMSAVPAGAPQGAIVVIDPTSRGVVAMVGGYEYADYPYNRAVRALRQPGSAFKPFVWGAALESRRFTPASTLIDAPETLRVHKGKFWKPKNYTGKFRGMVTLRDALAHSVNSVAVALAEDVGIANVHAFARKAGIISDLADGLAVALGASEVSPIELANAYVTIVDDGRQAPVRFITHIGAGDDEVSLEPPQWEQTIDPGVAWLVRDLMRSVVTTGSGRRLKKFGRPIAGKTGTTNEARNTWFVGLLPDAVTVAWVGFDDNRSLGDKESGARTALPIVKAYVESAEAKGARWPVRPNSVLRLRVVADGRLAPARAAKSREEVFLSGTQPTEVAPEAGQLDANSFFFEENGVSPLAEDGPPVGVPSIGVQPVSPNLRPIMPAHARPAPPPKPPPLDDDSGPITPLSPAPGAPVHDEDAPL